MDRTGHLPAIRSSFGVTPNATPQETELVRYDLSTSISTLIAHFGRQPAWSPDGETLAVATDGGIILMSPDGNESVLIHGGGSSPQWQPET